MFYPRFGCVFVHGLREHMNFEECLDYFNFFELKTSLFAWIILFFLLVKCLDYTEET